MIAVILAAGKGTRLYPYTKYKPKCMIKINDVSILEKQISILKKNKNIKKIILISGYKSKLIKNSNIIKIYNSRFKSTNMLWSFYLAREYFYDDILLSYGDILYSSNLLNKMVRSKNNISVAIDKKWKSYWSKRFKNIKDDVESLYLDKDNFIKSIGQKDINISKMGGQYIGLTKFSKSTIKKCKVELDKMFKKTYYKENKNKYITDFLQSLINNNFKVKAIPFFDNWIEIDSVKDITQQYNIDRFNKIK